MKKYAIGFVGGVITVNLAMNVVMHTGGSIKSALDMTFRPFWLDLEEITD